MASANAGRKLIQEARKLHETLERSKLSLRAIARRRKVSPASLSQLLAILRLPDDILREVEDNPKLASKTKLAMLARTQGVEQQQLWQRIRDGISSDVLRNRQRGQGPTLSDSAREKLKGIGHSMRRELAGELPPGSFRSERILEFSLEILDQLWRNRRAHVLNSYMDFIDQVVDDELEQDAEDDEEIVRWD